MSTTGLAPRRCRRPGAQSRLSFRKPLAEPLERRLLLASAGSFTNIDFGNTRLGRISGTKFNDENANGVRDPGEAGLQGWTIFLDGNGNGQLDFREPSDVTAADGSYAFNVAASGTPYMVREVEQTGWRQTLPVGGVYTVPVSSGAIASDLDFGSTSAEVVTGRKFNDANADGV